MKTKMFTVHHQWADDLIMMTTPTLTSVLTVHVEKKLIKGAVHLLFVTSLFFSKIVCCFFFKQIFFCGRSKPFSYKKKYKNMIVTIKLVTHVVICDFKRFSFDQQFLVKVD